MKDVSLEVAMPLRLSNIIWRLSNCLLLLLLVSICCGTGICGRAIPAQEMKEKDTVLDVMKVEMHNANILTSSNIVNQENNYSQSVVSVTDKMGNEQNVDSGTKCEDELVTSDNRKSIGSPLITNKPDFLDSDDNRKNIGGPLITDKPAFLDSESNSEIVMDLVVAVNNVDVELGGPKKRLSTMNLEGVKEKKINTSLEDLVVGAVSNVDVEIGGLNQKEATMLLDETQVEKNMSSRDTVVNVDMETGGSKQILSTTHLSSIQKSTMKAPRKHNLFNFVPNWGFTALQGGRSEMEDALVGIPNFLEIPTPVLTLVSNEFNQTLSQSTAHFFGVYDGHGGCEVANYCRDRIHLALAEEFKLAKENLESKGVADNWQEELEKAFLRCFRKVDMEVAGTADAEEHEPIASNAVGSTAVVTVICSTHIMVANCGDSRAVLCRGKESLALSLDHKAGRYDERKRIEDAGGMVIYWDEFRVSGVLAMSRSIGDRYLAPYIISDPEMMFVSRTKEDDCLILATDGLWDVVSTEEACDLARKRILLWHRKNASMLTSSGEGNNSAAQDAATYLSELALQRGSQDNISVIVVDLKAQRKFKKKTETTK